MLREMAALLSPSTLSSRRSSAADRQSVKRDYTAFRNVWTHSRPMTLYIIHPQIAAIVT